MLRVPPVLRACEEIASVQKLSFRDGPPGPGPEAMNTGDSDIRMVPCSWVPGSRTVSAPRNDDVQEFLHLFGLLEIDQDGVGAKEGDHDRQEIDEVA
jgi:hypothetical protein